MSCSYTIIDSFRVTPALSGSMDGLRVGTWYVLAGTFHQPSQLPPAGTTVTITEPAGNEYVATVAAVAIRHSSAALSFAPSAPDQLPRMSIVTS